MGDKPPTERYITIIIEGCEHYGVKREYIDWLKSLEYQKRKDPSEFDTIPVPENAPTMTMDDVKAADGVGDNPLYMTVNGKVMNIPKLEGPAKQIFKITKNTNREVCILRRLLCMRCCTIRCLV